MLLNFLSCVWFRAENKMNQPTQSNIVLTQEVLSPMRTIDHALSLSGLGRFHFRFILAVLFAHTSNVCVSLSPSYLLPNANELRMSLNQKGLLNAMVYMGMFSSGFFAGFLTDTFGRRLAIVYGYFAIFLVGGLLGSLTQSFTYLLCVKFFEGFVLCAAYNAMLTICSEIVDTQRRERFMVLSSSLMAVAQVISTLFAWWILPHSYEHRFPSLGLAFHAWNYYLLGCGIVGLITSLMFAFLPESPKFLVAHQEYDKALKVVTSIYKENTRAPADTFPIKYIGEPTKTPTADLSFFQKIRLNLSESKNLFYPPYVSNLITICVLQVLTMLTYNVFRLWYPQLSTIIEQYSARNKDNPDLSYKLCVILDEYVESQSASGNKTKVADKNRSGSQTYINGIVLGFVCLVPYFVNCILVNRIGKKNLLLMSMTISLLLVVFMIFSSGTFQVLFAVSTTVALTQSCVSLHQAFTVDLFPTVSKSLAVSLMMMAGRLGSLIGNIGFPILLSYGCAVPFTTIAIFEIFAILLILRLPKRRI